jgi:hypothetical protein
MVVAPTCDEHASPVALSQALQEARAEVAQLRRHLKRYHPPGHCEILEGLGSLPDPDEGDE